ncbi:MAG TPA: hypothetical protein VFC63_09420 [Blastocatellia bacterium]|nr:hypothetical protein [Blastocatellia bacterium]
MKTSLGEAELRSLTVNEFDAIVRFWYESGDEFLDYLGIDRAALGTVEDTRFRFLSAIPNGDPHQRSLAFAIMLNGEMAGYTLLNQRTPEENYSHWHIIKPGLRGLGLSTALYPYRVKTCFDAAPIERLIHQTRTRNVAVNRMLDR